MPAPDGPIIKIFKVGNDSSDAIVAKFVTVCGEVEMQTSLEVDQNIKVQDFGNDVHR